jgi:hypothetical protein
MRSMSRAKSFVGIERRKNTSITATTTDAPPIVEYRSVRRIEIKIFRKNEKSSCEVYTTTLQSFNHDKPIGLHILHLGKLY